MNTNNQSRFILLGGICGIIGTLCYTATISIPMNRWALYILVMAWPVLSIIFAFSLYKYVAHDHQSGANQLAFLFACLGFTIVACMISVQLAVRLGLEDIVSESPDREEFLALIRQAIRFVDYGLDVAWDVFIGTSLIFMAVAIKPHPRFRIWWALPAGILGAAIIVLNVITFPWPPNTQGLFDIGPGVGVFIIALSARLIWIGRHFVHD